MDVDKRLEMSLDEVIKEAKDKSQALKRGQGRGRGRGRSTAKGSEFAAKRARQSLTLSADAREAGLANKRSLEPALQTKQRVLKGNTVVVRGRGRGRGRGSGRQQRQDAFYDDPANITVRIVNERAFQGQQQQQAPAFPAAFPGARQSAPYRASASTSAFAARTSPLRRTSAPPPYALAQANGPGQRPIGRAASRDGGGDRLLRDDWLRGDSVAQAHKADPFASATGPMRMDIESDDHTMTAVPYRHLR